MELKQHTMTHQNLLHGLLIVPYGIETRIFYSQRKSDGLLIVPYGIETI